MHTVSFVKNERAMSWELGKTILSYLIWELVDCDPSCCVTPGPTLT